MVDFMMINLGEALDAPEEGHAFLTKAGVFPKRLIEIRIQNKRAEEARYNQMPQPVEYGMYYDL